MSSFLIPPLSPSSYSHKNTLPSLLLSSSSKKQSADMQLINKINLEVFGNKSFKSQQEQVIKSVLNKDDIFVCMPTGAGKSLTFQIPAYISPGITIVIMPLISLIQDQLKRLENLGIKSKVISGSLTKKQEKLAYEAIESQQDIKIVFLTPEKLSKCERLSVFLQKLHENQRISRFVIDEAHCVSKWGREFRADYLKLSSLRKEFPGVQILALTGTATEAVRKDVVKVLGMKNPKFFLAGYNRPNLFFQVLPKTKQVIEDIASIINSRFKLKTGLVYCVSKKDCEKVSAGLRNNGIVSGFYHADVPQGKRNEIQQEWMEGSVQVLVATIAFGMGIDKRDVRFVIHHSFPKSIENYYQESGRAGRDDLKSDCIVFYDYADKKKHSGLINENKRQEFNFHEIAVVMKYCEDFSTCRRKQILAYFGESFDEKLCNEFCDNCRNKKESVAKDWSEEGLVCLEFVNDLPKGISTLPQVAGFLKGANQKASVLTKGNKHFGVLAYLKLQDIETLLRHMIYEEVLSEKLVKAFKKFKKTKLLVGPKAFGFKQRQFKLVVMTELGRNQISIPGTSVKELEKIKVKRPELEGPFTEKKLFVYEDSSKKPDLLPLPKIKVNEALPRLSRSFNETIVLDIEDSINFSDKIEKITKERIERKSVENSNVLKDKNIDKKPSHCSMTQDMIDEMQQRLQIVRKFLSKKLQKSEAAILSDYELESAARTLNGNLRSEFIREINFFKEIHQIKELYKFELDLDSIDTDELMLSLENKQLKV